MSDTPNPGRWAFVEMMGHRREFGLVTEVTFAGTQLMHVATPKEDGSFSEKIISPASLYCLTFTTEDVVRAHLFPPARPALAAATLHYYDGNDEGECSVCGDDRIAGDHFCNDPDCMPRRHPVADRGCVDCLDTIDHEGAF